MILSKNQQEIVNATDKYLYVIAGAGSGKTRTLTERIKSLVSKNNHGEKVLAITFSNKAANELNDRLLHSFTGEQLHNSVYIGTIHNFCMEIVIQRGASIGLSTDLHIFESIEDRLEIFKNAIASIPQLKQKYLSTGSDNRKWIRDSLDALSKAKRNLMFPSDYNEKPISKLLYQEYQNLLLIQNAIDFDDILLYAYRILAEKESILKIYQRIYKYICVDEAQDLNKAQYEVIKILAGTNSSICMVGDPNQAIYGFNGSSSRYMNIYFPKDFNAKKFELLENYRSSQAVINAAKIIEPSFVMDGQLPIKGDVDVRIFDDELSEATWISEKIDSLLKNGHHDIEGSMVLPQQCAVLARNRYVFNTLIGLFDNQDKEYNLRISASQGLLSESIFFKIFDLGLRIIMNRQDALHLSNIVSLLGSKSNISTLDDIKKSKELCSVLGENGAVTISAVWEDIQAASGSFRFDRILDILASFCESESNFSEDSERSLVYNDYLSWRKRWDMYVKNSSIEERNLSHMMRSIALGITNIAKESGITLSTVHMSKGLEFDVVFIMGLNEGIFPDYRSLRDEMQLNEEQNNMFVSITRSKRLCFLTCPKERVMPWGGSKSQLPSRYMVQLMQH